MNLILHHPTKVLPDMWHQRTKVLPDILQRKFLKAYVSLYCWSASLHRKRNGGKVLASGCTTNNFAPLIAQLWRKGEKRKFGKSFLLLGCFHTPELLLTYWSIKISWSSVSSFFNQIFHLENEKGIFKWRFDYFHSLGIKNVDNEGFMMKFEMEFIYLSRALRRNLIL